VRISRRKEERAGEVRRAVDVQLSEENFKGHETAQITWRWGAGEGSK